MKKILYVIMIIGLTGCASAGWKKATIESYSDKTRKFSSMLPAGWMYYAANKNFIVTKDGVILDAIEIMRFKYDEIIPNTKKVFKSSMMTDELCEVAISAYESSPQNLKFEVLSKENLKLSGQDAFEFKFRYQTKEGLWKKGIHYGFKYKDFVYGVIYEAAEQHYYDKYEKDFQAFVNDFRLI